MKTAIETLSTDKTEHTLQNSPAKPRSVLMRYVAAAVLLAIVYFLSSLTPAEGGVNSFQIAPSFILFWLAGGGITLALLG
ncbi:MAG: hypothetical protein V7709_20220, partial [Halioglobus sp.]